MSIGSGSPPGGVGSAGVPGNGGLSGIAGTSGTDSGITYSACIAPETFPGGRAPKRPRNGAATLPGFKGSCGRCETFLRARL